MKKNNFLLESLRNFKSVGAVAVCSPFVAKKMTKPVDFSRAMLIVELGGGTGAITKDILARMRPDAELVVFEINPYFAERLMRLDDPRLTVVNDTAERLCGYLASRDIQRADAIISTLPISLMDSHIRAKIFEEVTNALSAEGCFVQVQYSLISKKEIKEKFPVVTFSFTPFNLPPAFFYICER